MPDLTWDSGTDPWDSASDTWDAQTVVDPDDPPPIDPEDPVTGGTAAAFAKRTLPKADPTGVYRYLVGDLLTGDILEELPLSTVTYGFLRNRPGGFDGSVQKKHRKVRRSQLPPEPFAMYVDRDGVLLWGGIVWTVEPREEEVAFAGEGFWSHFRKIRHYGIADPGRPDHNKLKRYNDVDQFDIVRDVIDYAQTYEPDHDLGVEVDPWMSGTVRDEVFRPWAPRIIGEAIEDMAELNNGFDFSLDVEWNGNTPAKKLHLFSQRGRLTTVVFDDHKNCSMRSRTIDAKDVVRQVTATGSGSGAALRRYTVTDATLAGRTPLYQDVVSYSEVEDISTLASRATKQVNRRMTPMETISINVTPQRDLAIGSWRAGDYVRVRLDDEYDPFDKDVRIVGWQGTVDQEGQEAVTMDFGPIPS